MYAGFWLNITYLSISYIKIKLITNASNSRYDPSLTYGRVKAAAVAQVIPHWVHYDKRCLNFTAFFKQPVYDSPDEAFRVRVVNIIYFLEDDTMTVMEPQVRVSLLI